MAKGVRLATELVVLHLLIPGGNTASMRGPSEDQNTLYGG